MSFSDVARNHATEPGRAFRPSPSLRTIALTSLVVLTSVAVGATTSIWFVPPYLLAMGWLLHAPESPPVGPSLELPPTLPQSPGSASEPAPSSSDRPDAPAAETAPPKPRKRRPRNAAKAEPPQPTVRVEATWVQVTPGKFVRVERPIAESDDAMPSTMPAESGDTDIADMRPEVGTIAAEVADTRSSENDSSDPPTHEIENREREDGRESLIPDLETIVPVLSDPQQEDDLRQFSPSDVDHRQGSFREPIRGLTIPMDPAPPTDSEAASIPCMESGDDFDEESPHAEWLDMDEGPAGLDRHQAEEDGPFDHHATLSASPARHGFGPRHVPIAASRSFRVRRDPRPASRRGTGRVGASPRVSLGRS